MTCQAVVIRKPKVFMELGDLRNACCTRAVASKTLCASCCAVRNLGWTTSGTARSRCRCGCCRGAWFMTCLACGNGPTDMIGWEWICFSSRSVTNQAVRVTARWMRNGFGRCIGRRDRSNRRFDNLRELRRVQAGKFPLGAVTGVIGAER